MDIEAAPHKPLERSLVFLVVLLWHLRLLACPPLFLFPYTKGEKGKAESSFATEEQWQRQQSHRNWRQKLFCYWRPLLPKKSQRRSKVISERMPTKLIVEYHNFFFPMCVFWQANQSLMCQRIKSRPAWLPSIIKELSETYRLVVTPVTNVEFMRSLNSIFDEVQLHA